MAKRKKKKDDGAALALPLLFGLMAAIVIFLTLISSFALLFAWIYYNHKLNKLPKPTALSDFVFTQSEKETVVGLHNFLISSRAKLAICWAKGSHLSRRQDGYFQERSQLAKQLNPLIRKHEEDISRAEVMLHTYEEFPQRRYEHYSEVLGWQRGLTFSIFIYVCILIWQTLAPFNWVVDFSIFLNKNGFLAQPFGLQTLWGAMAVAAFAAVITTAWSRTTVSSDIRSELDKGDGMSEDGAIHYSELFAMASKIGDW